jgi:hypothetical protein
MADVVCLGDLLIDFVPTVIGARSVERRRASLLDRGGALIDPARQPEEGRAGTATSLAGLESS